MFVVIGGCGEDDEDYLNSVERFDPREGSKSVQVKNMKECRSYAAAAELNGFIYMTGGRNEKRLDTVEMFAPFCFIYFALKFAFYY